MNPPVVTREFEANLAYHGPDPKIAAVIYLNEDFIFINDYYILDKDKHRMRLRVRMPIHRDFEIDRNPRP